MNSSRFFWGLMIVLIGALWLLSNFGLLPGNFWFEIWRLWPLLLVLWGLSLLIGKEGRAGVIFSVIMSVIVIGCVVLFGWIYNSGRNIELSKSTISVDKDSSIEEAQINLNFGAGSLELDSGSDKLVEGDAESYSDISAETSIFGKKETVTISQKNLNFGLWRVGNQRNDIILKLATGLPIELNLDTGASKYDLDLTDVSLSKLTIDAGASSGDIRLGSKLDNTEVVISAGASSFNIKVPKDSALKIVNKSGFSSHNFSSLDLERNGEEWKSQSYDSALKKIEMTFSSGATSINIEKY